MPVRSVSIRATMTIPIPVVLTKLWKPKRSPIKGLDKEQRIVREKVCLFFLTIVVNKTIFPLQKFISDPPPPPLLQLIKWWMQSVTQVYLSVTICNLYPSTPTFREIHIWEKSSSRSTHLISHFELPTRLKHFNRYSGFMLFNGKS